MKTIGLIGGMSWESTATYYNWLNKGVNARLGGLHSAAIKMASVDFHDIECFQASGEWDKAGTALGREAVNLERAGADFLILATNTMHKVAPQIAGAVKIPFLHLADATAEAIAATDIGRIGLLGTRYTMEQDFYKERLVNKGLDVIIPDAAGREAVNAVIYDELCNGHIRQESRKLFLQTAQDLFAAGAEGIILGCTEINMLLSPDDFTQPVFDTTRIHVDKAVDYALGV